MLKSVVIAASSIKRKELLKIFRDKFLGDNKYGRNCEILNEEDIRIWFNSTLNVIFAIAEKPLIINNKLLNKVRLTNL